MKSIDLSGIERIVDEFTSSTKATPIDRSGFYVFISLDLVDSAKYKSADVNDWQTLIFKFYTRVVDYFNKRLASVNLWKYVGDEVLMYVPISKSKTIPQCIECAYEALHDITIELQNQHNEGKYKSYIRLKGTIWGAFCSENNIESKSKVDTMNHYWTNVIITPPVQPYITERTIDFLGPQIDAGFRLSHCVGPNRLVISAELAYLCVLSIKKYELDQSLINRLKVVALKPLKGIWHERAYPIIWLEDDETKSSYTQGYHYDELVVSDPVKKMITATQSSEIKEQTSEFLEKVFFDLNYLDRINEVFTVINSFRPDNQYYFDSPKPIITPIHLVAVCVQAKTKKILIARRSEKKGTYPSCWEFGCSQLKLNETFHQSIVDAYQLDFNIRINGNKIIPISTFELKYQDKNTVPGLIFAAMVDTQSLKYDGTKHTETRWVSKEDVHGIDKSICVPDFHDTFAKALKAFE